MTTILETLAKIVGELNERCYDESIATGLGLSPFTLKTSGSETCVEFFGNTVLTDDEINDGNDPDERVWRELIEEEAIDYMLALRTLTIRDEHKDIGRCVPCVDEDVP